MSEQSSVSAEYLENRKTSANALLILGGIMVLVGVVGSLIVALAIWVPGRLSPVNMTVSLRQGTQIAQVEYTVHLDDLRETLANLNRGCVRNHLICTVNLVSTRPHPDMSKKSKLALLSLALDLSHSVQYDSWRHNYLVLMNLQTAYLQKQQSEDYVVLGCFSLLTLLGVGFVTTSSRRLRCLEKTMPL